MTAFTNHADVVFDPQKPILGSTHLEARDNLAATAEGSADAPAIEAGWYPYDADIRGAGDGVIWDYATDGAVGDIVTPNFADGFEYLIRMDDISISTGGVNMVFEMYKETDAAYQTVLTSDGLSSASTKYHAIFQVNLPRVLKKAHQITFQEPLNDGAASHISSIDRSATMYDNTRQKILKMRLDLTVGATFDNGTVYLYKRAEFVSR